MYWQSFSEYTFEIQLSKGRVLLQRFGQSTSTRTNMRNLQFALKYMF